MSSGTASASACTLNTIVRANMAAPEEDRLPEEEIVGQMSYVNS